mmetsp:Transcript_29988/g.63939  ORF Transcript_29988/g.63939 Transcript_29988/m.63939 type:complete len:275 (-) Transcript_29988:1662-2486(-)
MSIRLLHASWHWAMAWSATAGPRWPVAFSRIWTTASLAAVGGRRSHARETMCPRHCATKKGSRAAEWPLLVPLWRKRLLRVDITRPAMGRQDLFKQPKSVFECRSRNSLTCTATSRLSGSPTQRASKICSVRVEISRSCATPPCASTGTAVLSRAASTSLLEARQRMTPEEARTRQPSLEQAISRKSVRIPLNMYRSLPGSAGCMCMCMQPPPLPAAAATWPPPKAPKAAGTEAPRSLARVTMTPQERTSCKMVPKGSAATSMLSACSASALVK